MALAVQQPMLDIPWDLPLPSGRRDDFEEWLAEVHSAFEQAARSGAEFTTYDVARRHLLPEPPDPAHDWGRLMVVLHAEGLLVPAGWACSARPSVHASGVRTWRGARTAWLGRAA